MVNTFFIIGAQVYLDQERYEECIADCEAAIKLNPEGPKAYYRKGLALRELQCL
jgi:tetratricopeptide (TPR) repeat protein